MSEGTPEGANGGGAGPLLRWLVVPSLLLFGGWRLFLFSGTRFDSGTSVAIGLLVGLLVVWAYASLVAALDRLDPRALLVAGLASLAPLLRTALGGAEALRETLRAHPSTATVDLVLAVLLAVVTAPVCFVLYKRASH